MSRKGILTVIASYPGGGRTESALKIVMKHLADGDPCIYISLRYPEETLRRLINLIANVRENDIPYTGLLDIREPGSCSIPEIKDIISDYIRQGLAPRVVIDYAEMLTSQNMATLMASCRDIADTDGIDIYILTETKRSCKVKGEKQFTISQITLPGVETYADRILFSSPARRPVPLLKTLKDTCSNMGNDNKAAFRRQTDEDIDAIRDRILEIRAARMSVDERTVRSRITDTLLHVAANPRTRKDYIVKTADGRTLPCTTNNPMMSSVESLAMAMHYCRNLTNTRTSEQFDTLKGRITEIIEKIENTVDYCRAMSCLLRAEYRWHMLKKQYDDARECLLEALDYTTNTPDGVDYSDIDYLVDVLRKSGSTELSKWILDTMDQIGMIDGWMYMDTWKETRREYEAYAAKVVETIDRSWDNVKDNPLFSGLEWLPYALAQASDAVPGRQNRSPKKGSFDWHYARAEKGYLDSMAFISDAYRTGDGVMQNDLMADIWNCFREEKLESNGKPPTVLTTTESATCREIKATGGTLPGGGVSARVFFCDREERPAAEEDSDYATYVEYDENGEEIFSRILEGKGQDGNDSIL